jgi:transposase
VFRLDQIRLFSAALGLKSPWEVIYVAFDVHKGRIDLHAGFVPGTRFDCPQCGAYHPPVHDTQERAWRHLNFSEHQTVHHVQVPSVRCAVCAETTQLEVPWARPGGGSTRLMEALLVILRKAMPVRQVFPAIRAESE